MSPIEMANLLERVKDEGFDAVERSDLLDAAALLKTLCRRMELVQADNCRLREAFEKVTALLLRPEKHDPNGYKFYDKWTKAEQACRDVLCMGGAINPGREPGGASNG